MANNHSNTSTLYDGNGNPIPLVVTVGGAPTGTVFNGGSGFHVTHDGAEGPSVFLFATESGVIRGWNPNVPMPAPSTKAFRMVDMRSDGAIFKGLAIAPTSGGDRLYATDFHNGRVDVFDERFHLVDMPGAFEDPNIPAGYAPVRDPERRQQDRRHLREAGRRRRGRRGGRRLRVRRHVRQVGEVAPADRFDGCARRAVGYRDGLPTTSASSAAIC